jgi:alpha/beta superfamily hydrolase
MPHDLTITTADGVLLEAEADSPIGATTVAVLTHPHPSYGGDMHNLVPSTLFRALPAVGIGALRFNFRGVGKSTGSYGDGVDEHNDVVAAIDTAAAHAGVQRVAGVGYSFGADVLLSIEHQALTSVIVVAPPLQLLDLALLREPRGAHPTLILAPEHDQFRTAAAAAETVTGWPSTTVETIPGTDHFLAGAASWIAHRVTTALTAG